MSELKKLETNEYSSKLDEIAKNDTEVFLKVKLSGRRTFGEYEFEPKNGFAVHFGNHIDVLDLDKCDVYQLDQPQLNENQQIVLDWLKKRQLEFNERPSTIIYFLTIHYPYGLDDVAKAKKAFSKLNKPEENQVLEVFLKWALEQGNECE